MNPRQNLRQDHGHIMQMLVVLHKAVKNPARRAEWIEKFEGLMDFALVYIDRCHHAKEEDILFPALEKQQNAGGDLVSRLCREHRDGHALIEAILQQFNALKSRPELSFAELTRLSERYIALYRKHIRRENAQLLPLMEACLPAARQARIMQQFQRLESESMPPRQLKAFLALLKPARDQGPAKGTTAKK